MIKTPNSVDSWGEKTRGNGTVKHKHRKPKSRPYGAKRTREWCPGCDAQLVVPQPSKKRARRLRIEDEQS